MAVTLQPGSAMVMSALPQPLPGLPVGLEHLASVDELLIKQRISASDCCETMNSYDIYSGVHDQSYLCTEENKSCNTCCGGLNRAFTFRIYDNNQREVLSLERPFKCCGGCGWCADGCCEYPVFVMDGHGQKIGMVRPTKYCCQPHFGIFDQWDTQLYQLVGVCCDCQCCCCKNDLDFPVTSVKDNLKVANVSKVWDGVMEMLTNADLYKVTFPMEMHVIHKALIFASVFLVDMWLYEEYNEDNSNCPVIFVSM